MSDTLKTGEVNYDVSYSPDPLVIDIKLSSENKKIKVKIDDVPGLKVMLEPKFTTWNPVNNILTAVGSLTSILASEIPWALSKLVKLIPPIDVYNVPDIPIDPAGVKLKISPSNIKLENENGLLMVSGDIDISGS
ncbi:MAG: hypothetical protein QNJ36_15210 [Calothrix sp. MO_167.B42]|nr:hypothetical protein [Calothrix sp. MO_167.B42]